MNTRPGYSLTSLPTSLGLLSDLEGTWVGTGFSLVELPDFDSTFPSTGPAPFRLKLNRTIETLQFTPVGGPVPNRGVITSFTDQKTSPKIDDVVGELMRGHTPLTSRSHALHGNALR